MGSPRRHSSALGEEQSFSPIGHHIFNQDFRLASVETKVVAFDRGQGRLLVVFIQPLGKADQVCFAVDQTLATDLDFITICKGQIGDDIVIAAAPEYKSVAPFAAGQGIVIAAADRSARQDRR